jgi:hypothetical protein
MAGSKILLGGAIPTDTDTLVFGFALSLRRDETFKEAVPFGMPVSIRGRQDRYWHREDGTVSGSDIGGHEHESEWQFVLQGLAAHTGTIHDGDDLTIVNAAGTRALAVRGDKLVDVLIGDATVFRLTRLPAGQ